MSGSEPQSDVSRAALEAFRARHADISAVGELRADLSARVTRLDRPGTYLLVPIRDASGLRGIVQLDAQGTTVELSVSVRNPASQFLVTESEALAAAQGALPGKYGWGQPFLAWQPCRESFDSMRPLWVVTHAEGRAYVTQNCEVFEVLTSGRGG